MPIYKVNLTRTVDVDGYVYAKDEKEAKEVAQYHATDMLDDYFDPDIDDYVSVEDVIDSFEKIPSNEEHVVPYGDTELSISELLEEQYGTIVEIEAEAKAREFNDKYQTTLADFNNE